jgi:3-methyladenine DNA glycosylase Tag
MKLEILNSIYKQAFTYMQTHKAEELEWARGINENTFKNIKAKIFLSEYCWVVYASGFKVSIVEEKFPFLKSAFKDFDLDALSRMRSVTQALKVVNHRGKAEGFLEGAKKICNEGFGNFKNRLRKDGIDVLCELPFIADITKKHLAKNIGFMDVAKDDIWLERIRELASAKNVEELTRYLSKKHGESEHVIDVVLWRYCADKGLPKA